MKIMASSPITSWKIKEGKVEEVKDFISLGSKITWTVTAVLLEPQKIKSATVSIVSPSICYEVIGPDAMILVF